MGRLIVWPAGRPREGRQAQVLDAVWRRPGNGPCTLTVTGEPVRADWFCPDARLDGVFEFDRAGVLHYFAFRGELAQTSPPECPGVFAWVVHVADLRDAYPIEWAAAIEAAGVPAPPPVPESWRDRPPLL